MKKNSEYYTPNKIYTHKSILYTCKFIGYQGNKPTYEIVTTNEISGFKVGDKFTPNDPEKWFDITDTFIPPTPVKETEPEQPYYKGKGEHSVNQLEAICSQYKEYVSFLNSRGNDTTPTSKEGLTYKVECLDNSTAHYTHDKKEAYEVYAKFIIDFGDTIRLYEAPMPINDHDEIDWETIECYDVDENESKEGLEDGGFIEEKDKLIDILIEDLQANEYESREYVYDLVRDALRSRTLCDLKDLVNNNQPE